MTTLDFLFRVEHRAGKTVPTHLHRCCELVYYVSGRGHTRIGSNDIPFENGTFALIRPHTPHDERRTETSDIICVGFTAAGDAPTMPEGVFRDADGTLLPLLERMLDEIAEKLSLTPTLTPLFSIKWNVMA